MLQYILCTIVISWSQPEIFFFRNKVIHTYIVIYLQKCVSNQSQSSKSKEEGSVHVVTKNGSCDTPCYTNDYGLVAAMALSPANDVSQDITDSDNVNHTSLLW